MSASRPRHLTIHARLVKGCNADCGYCSSWQQDPGSRMSPEEFSRALGFVLDRVLPTMGCGGPDSTVSIQYVGGEILLVPKAELRQIVYDARSVLQEHFGTVIDGVQSNLVGSERRVLELDTLFGGRVGTSVDGRGSQRTVGGSAYAYRRIADRSRAVLSARRKRSPGAIFVVDRQGLGSLSHEVEQAHLNRYPLVLRPVFSGGREVADATPAELADGMVRAFDLWAMTSSVSVEPFHQLLSRRLHGGEAGGGACPFQRNCAEVSIDIEPDGTLYTCLDMADSGQMPFGNALRGEFFEDVWQTLAMRVSMIDPRCSSCPFFAACQGGCMSEAIHHTGSVYGRSDLCMVWTALFNRIDCLIAEHGRESVSRWLSSCAR